MTTLHKPIHWELVKHEPNSDYGEDAYTLWPYGAIIKGLPSEAAAIINATPAMLKELETVRECCLEALDDQWDRSDDGFIAILLGIDAILTKAKQQ